MKQTSYKRMLMPGQVKQILLITLAWTVISVIQFFSSYFTLIEMDCGMEQINPLPYLGGSIVTGVTAGILGGSLLVFFWGQWLRTKAYGWSLLRIVWSYSLIYLLVSAVGSIAFTAAQTGMSVLEPALWRESFSDFNSLGSIHGYFYWLIVILITFIALLVNDKYGPGVFAAFLMGKYFQPRQEARIFMFLDLRGSTTIAEKLGEEQYFRFLRDVFSDATPPILRTKGEIYQYVGDEIVVSWPEKTGSYNANCLQCFFEVRRQFEKRRSYYEEQYQGLFPEFKAGLHNGKVMAGEIGVVKRDIAYSGDVLNTTARIQGKCNELGVNVLLSKYLLEKLGPLPPWLKPQKIGAIPLRGKIQDVMLYTV